MRARALLAAPLLAAAAQAAASDDGRLGRSPEGLLMR